MIYSRVANSAALLHLLALDQLYQPIHLILPTLVSSHHPSFSLVASHLNLSQLSSAQLSACDFSERSSSIVRSVANNRWDRRRKCACMGLDLNIYLLLSTASQRLSARLQSGEKFVSTIPVIIFKLKFFIFWLDCDLQ